METERIPRDVVKTRKGLDLTPVTSVRDDWNIPEEPIAAFLCLSYPSLSLYSLFHTIVRRFCLTGLKDVSGGFPLEHKEPSKLSNDLWNVSSPRHTYSLSHAISAPDNTLRSCEYILANIILIHFPGRLLSSCEMWVLDI